MEYARAPQSGRVPDGVGTSASSASSAQGDGSPARSASAGPRGAGDRTKAARRDADMVGQAASPPPPKKAKPSPKPSPQQEFLGPLMCMVPKGISAGQLIQVLTPAGLMQVLCVYHVSPLSRYRLRARGIRGARSKVRLLASSQLLPPSGHALPRLLSLAHAQTHMHPPTRTHAYTRTRIRTTRLHT